MLFKNRKGTSLIEAAISIALIGIMLLWAAKIYANSLKNTGSTSDIEIATHLASEQIENLKKLNKSDLENLPFGVRQTSVSYPNYEYEYVDHGEQVNNDDTVWLKDIEVDVYRKGKSNPLIKMECNFLRKSDDGSNIGT